ncbi:putative T7SS-secreted protein [Streptomyces sp. MAR4 CNX-425]|uniref:putative T7SS-secreted protein n=1 Tax=Streptomyces sp. MAR4 CNX-425 TaxID=3406343 RepID=UPI003B50154B
MAPPEPSRSFPTLGFDPAPGDVHRTTSLAKRIGGVAGELRDTVFDLERISCGAWKGKAAVAFSDYVSDDVTPKLREARDSFEKASYALQRWSNQLRDFQEEAADLEREAKRRQQEAEDAKLALTTATGAVEDSDGEREEKRAEKDKERKEEAASDADSALQRVIDRAEELRDRYHAAAERITDDLDGASDMAPDEPGLFDKITGGIADAFGDAVDWVQEHADFIKAIGDLLSTLSGILGVLAIITAPFEPIGAIFAVAAMATSALALVTHLTAMAAGADVSWMDIGIDALGIIPGVKGVIGGAQLAKGTNAVARAAKLGGAYRGVTGMGKTFVLFGPLKSFPLIKGGSRMRLAAESAYQNVRMGQWLGTQGLNLVAKPLIKADELIAPMSNLGRGIDAGIKSALTGYKIHGLAERDFGFGDAFSNAAAAR